MRPSCYDLKLKIENQESPIAVGVAASFVILPALSSDMPPEPGVRQRIDDVPAARREAPKPLRQFRVVHGCNRRTAPSEIPSLRFSIIDFQFFATPHEASWGGMSPE